MRCSIRFLARGLGGLVCLTGLLVPNRLAAAQRPPNIIYLMSDELGYYELSCMGNPYLRTPNIDRLAAEGVRFTQALAGSSLCAPTRACFLTGKHSGHTSVRTNGGGTPLRAGEETIASVLKRVGYATGGFGKWGCGGRGSTGVPEKHGFDVFFGYYDQVHAHTYYPPYLIRNSEEVPLPGNHGGRQGQTYSHYRIFEEALRFIREHRDQPFFCYLPFTPPHGMFDIPETDPAWAMFKDQPWPEEAKRYAAMVAMVDRQVGELLDLLRELGLEERTIFFFSGDNGGADYFASKEHPRGFFGANVNPRNGVEFRGRKGNLYEGGLRVPMIVRWPGHIAPGRVSDFLWYFPDVLPTLAELAGVKPPSDIDGLSIVPELLGAKAAGRPPAVHRYLYWELGGQVAVRAGSWKAIRPGKNKPWELYDLSRDVSEAHNLAAERPERLAELQRYAAEAHEPVREGVFFDRTLHEKDRAAKWGGRPPASAANRPVHRLPKRGLLPSRDWKIYRVSSENTSNSRYARNAIDGDPRTVWHTRWSSGLARPPHELIIDLGAVRQVRAVWYLARQDAGWNGTIRDCEIYLAVEPDQFGPPAARATLKKTKAPQRIECRPAAARYVKLRALSEINGGPWASAAEIGVEGR